MLPTLKTPASLDALDRNDRSIRVVAESGRALDGLMNAPIHVAASTGVFNAR